MDLFNLAAKLTLDSRDYEKGVREANRSGHNLYTRLSNTFHEIGGVIATVFSGIAVKRIVSSFISITNAAAEAGDKIDKNSQILGLSREAYQEWEYILSQSGASIDSMTSAMRHMNNSILENTDDTREAFRELGVDVEMLQSMDFETQFDYLVNQFQQLAPSAKKAALAEAIFGQQGRQLLPLLNSSSDSMYELRKKAEELGLYMSNEGIDASVAYTDSWDNLKRAASAFGNTIALESMPKITELMDVLAKEIGEANKAFESAGWQGFFQFLHNPTDTLWEIFPERAPENLAEYRRFALGTEQGDIGWRSAFADERQHAYEELLKLAPEDYAMEFSIDISQAKEELKELAELLAAVTGNYSGITESNVQSRRRPRAAKADGYNAKGLWAVPYDGYETVLHRGERILSASQARHDTDTVDINGITDDIRNAILELVGSLKIELNNKTVGRVVGDSVTTRVNGNINNAQNRLLYGYGGKVR